MGLKPGFERLSTCCPGFGSQLDLGPPLLGNPERARLSLYLGRAVCEMEAHTGEAEACLPWPSHPLPPVRSSPVPFHSPAHLARVQRPKVRVPLSARDEQLRRSDPGCAGTCAPEMTFFDSGNVRWLPWEQWDAWAVLPLKQRAEMLERTGGFSGPWMAVRVTSWPCRPPCRARFMATPSL